MNYLQLATEYLERKVKGRYVTLKHIEPILNRLNPQLFSTEIIGKSVLEKPIYKVVFGSGSKKVLLWSQMHGNESTTTKGLFDFFNFLSSNHNLAKEISKNYTLCCIPILNPDGAEIYTRENANKVDLNRDAKLRTQPESEVLRAIVEDFKPDLCLNLHDQRTIFGTENTGLPATMSFLAPAYNKSRDYNDVRLQAIQIINEVFNELSKYIPNQIGRFDDSFNDNCIGDYLTTQEIPTILFEAGHFQDDYQRDEVRKFVFVALLKTLTVSHNTILDTDLKKYLKIPQNRKVFFDFYYKNVKIVKDNREKIINFSAQYTETLEIDKIIFEAQITKVDSDELFLGHKEYDCREMLFSSGLHNFPIVGEKANFFLNNSLKFNNGLEKV